MNSSTSQLTHNSFVSGLDLVFIRYLCVESLNQQSIQYGITGNVSGKSLLIMSYPVRLELIYCVET
jgi:hypothetical protein